MKRRFIICLLVFGLTHAVEDNVGSETTDIGSKVNSANINFRFLDKNKRGAAKLTNPDSPNFNHLSTSNAGSSTSSGGFKPSAATSNAPPFRYLHNQQYYQPNPYLTYVQLPQAAQIASQYSFQSNPVAHFLQTPTQIQYVATPTVAQVPQIKYQTFPNEYSSAAAAQDSSSASSAAASSHYASQQNSVAQTYVPASTGSSTSAAVSQAKQIQGFYPGYQSPQPFYYTQQPLLIFPASQPANFIYQHPNANYLLKQQQLANIYGGNRFGLYTPTQNSQLTYLVPMVVSQPEQDSTSTTSTLKSSDKTVSNTQQTASGNSFAYGTKA